MNERNRAIRVYLNTATFTNIGIFDPVDIRRNSGGVIRLQERFAIAE